MKEQERPNLVIVFPDQMRVQQLGFMKEDPVLTPCLDKFAEESLVLSQAVSNYPVCSPYRAMLMTGKYPHSNKVTTNCSSDSEPFNCELQESDICWSDILKQTGYSLGYVGKWHLDSPKTPYIDHYNVGVKWNEWCPPNRRHGFDYWHSYGTYNEHLNPMYWDTDDKREDAHYINQWSPEHEADIAIEFLKNSGGKYRDEKAPFALVISMNPPHMPYDLVPEKYVKMYNDFDIEALCEKPSIPPKGTKWGDYYREHVINQYAMVTGVDEQFGRILSVLEEKNLTKNTIVVFTSDHGDCLGVHNEQSKNNCYEESMRIPFIICWPKHIKPAQDNLLFSVPDIYPTLIELMGLSEKIPSNIEGTSFADIFLSERGIRPTSQLYTWIKYDKPQFGKRGVRTNKYTLSISVMPDKDTKTLLFDNLNDKHQMKNIAENNIAIVKELVQDELIPWLHKVNDPWLMNINTIL
jgi:arylsulfatase A-like enzyme